MCGCQIFKKGSITQNVFNFKAWAYIWSNEWHEKMKNFGSVNVIYMATERQNRQSRGELTAILSEYMDKLRTKNFLFLLLEFDT